MVAPRRSLVCSSSAHVKLTNWRVLCGDDQDPGARDSQLVFKKKPPHELKNLRPGESTGAWEEKRGSDCSRGIGTAAMEAPRAIIACPNGRGFLVADGDAIRFATWPEGFVITVAGEVSGKAGFLDGAPAHSSSRLQ